MISQKSWWLTFNITNWCDARDDFDYEMISMIDFVSGTWFWSWFLLDFDFVSGTSPTRCCWCWFPVLSTRWWSALSRYHGNDFKDGDFSSWTWSLYVMTFQAVFLMLLSTAYLCIVHYKFVFVTNFVKIIFFLQFQKYYDNHTDAGRCSTTKIFFFK